ncbi:FixH family protein [Halalkalibacter alkalisediminis]|uniref:FixH family protein n=1 Tax=Halalkalibacter alkalisediminis TaxID=935616 RepID=A0ABV6NF08_9BACI|nr:FixH family protein [Halalkalibacter alkalisediminis]
MKKLWPVALFVLLIGLVACGEEEPSRAGTEEIVDELTPIDVELMVPETAEVDEVVLFTSTVTQGDDVVEDANEVVYEIWMEGQREQSELIDADQQEGHIYSLKYTFTEVGVYHVQTHVTARGLHRMPTSQIQVGGAKENIDSHEEVHENEHQHQHQHSDVMIEERVEDDKLVIFVEVEGSPYKGAKVTIEMSSTEDEEVMWIDLVEADGGEYELLNIDGYSGAYFAIVHIEDDHIHEHVDIELNF